jgi:8-oxo-dGTP diphosphatase
VGFELLPEVFTLPQLQALYEAILGVRFDRRNFASKMLKLGILTPTGDRPADAARRIPQEYRFNPQKYEALKQSGFRLEF